MTALPLGAVFVAVGRAGIPVAGDHPELTGTGSGTAFTVNGNSSVVCGTVQTDNATVYVVDSVLIPKSGSRTDRPSPGARRVVRRAPRCVPEEG